MMAALAESPGPRPARLAVPRRGLQVAVTVGPPATGSEIPGIFFSPLEAAIWAALAGGPLNGKRLAVATAQQNSPGFRAVVGNLRQRRVIVHSAERGYEWAGTSGPPAAARAKERRAKTTPQYMRI
jgi:hypothetical protein